MILIRLKLTADLNVQDLVISPMGVGIFDFPSDKAAIATVSSLVDFVKENKTPFKRIRFIIPEIQHVNKSFAKPTSNMLLLVESVPAMHG